MDFSQLLLENMDTIIENWIEAVRHDEQIETTHELTYKAVRNSMPRVLQAMATILSKFQESDIQLLVETSLEHGIVRAEQGFEPSEIAREYRILRSIIFATLEEGLLRGAPTETLRAVRLIDTVIDEAIARCFKSYTEQRLQEFYLLQQQLRMTNQELTRLVRANQENLAQLTHELKTPITSIIGYSDLFLRQHRQSQEMRDFYPNLEHIERVLRSGQKLLHLLNDTLEISRYEAGKMQLQLVQIDVCNLFKDVLEMVEPSAQAKELEILVDCEHAPAQVLTDPLRLQQIVTNLLSNAIRYTESGSIKLECQLLSEEQWSIQVTDSGIGILEEDQNRIFEPYFRADLGEQCYLPNSTGLGLAIVSRLVKLLQGKIELVSNIGQGSTFTVTFPLNVTNQLKTA